MLPLAYPMTIYVLQTPIRLLGFLKSGLICNWKAFHSLCLYYPKSMFWNMEWLLTAFHTVMFVLDSWRRYEYKFKDFQKYHCLLHTAMVATGSSLCTFSGPIYLWQIWENETTSRLGDIWKSFPVTLSLLLLIFLITQQQSENI